MTSPNGQDSWEMHEEMIKNSEEFYQKVPYFLPKNLLVCFAYFWKLSREVLLVHWPDSQYENCMCSVRAWSLSPLLVKGIEFYWWIQLMWMTMSSLSLSKCKPDHLKFSHLQLKLPYHVVSIVSGALNDAAAKKYDLDSGRMVSCISDIQRACLMFKLHRLPVKKIGNSIWAEKGRSWENWHSIMYWSISFLYQTETARKIALN